MRFTEILNGLMSRVGEPELHRTRPSARENAAIRMGAMVPSLALRPKFRLTELGRAVLRVLVEAVGQKNSEIRHLAIFEIGRMEPGASCQECPFGLDDAFEKGDVQDRLRVTLALSFWGRRRRRPCRR